jgi:hypothetical protein
MANAACQSDQFGQLAPALTHFFLDGLGDGGAGFPSAF